MIYFLIKTALFVSIILLVFGVVPPQAGETMLTNLTFLLVVGVAIDISETKDKVSDVRKVMVAAYTRAE